jgi:hypothetical protein
MLEESVPHMVATSQRSHGVTHQVIYDMLLILLTFIFYDHVMHNHASIHNIQKNLLLLKPSWLLILVHKQNHSNLSFSISNSLSDEEKLNTTM